MTKKDGAGKRRKSERFESEETLEASEVAGYLEGLAGGLRDGKVLLGEQGAGFVAIISGGIEFEVQARHRKKKSRVSLTLSFRNQKPATDDARANDEAEPVPEGAATIPDEMSF